MFEELINPVKPFDEFKWRWASKTPTESINKKEILFGVLKVLVLHNKKKHATEEFQNDMIQLEDSIDGLKMSLSRKDKPVHKNIIENSGQYWKALGLINNTTDGSVDVSDLGLSIINDNLSDIEFIKYQIENFIIPNKIIENKEMIDLYKNSNIKIKPLDLLIKIFSLMVKIRKSPLDWYLTANELRKIVVPLSIDSKIPITTYIEHIFEYRVNPNSYDTWVDCTPDANDKRMVREYLLFLKNFNALTELDIKGGDSRYYVNEMTLELTLEYGIELDVLVDERKKKYKNASNLIYFGSPGTGKSYEVNQLTNGANVRKVTFHPEYDYSSFVGGYKPSMNGDEIVYKFVPQIFTNIYVEAWNNQGEHYFLQIEEINRGNCAEVFGDLFQLLDRRDNGSSEYGVSPSEELLLYLKEKLINTDEGLKKNEIKLPSNLSIIATMNTSDQSLFPMDSAFKRRWDWKYVPINYDIKDNKSSNFIIQFDNGDKYKWLEFLKAVNEKIVEATESQDKQLGNWFVKPKADNIITEEMFINKILFYLWNDVFKDEEKNLFQFSDNDQLVTMSYEDFFTNNNNSDLVTKLMTENLALSVIEEIAEAATIE